MHVTARRVLGVPDALVTLFRDGIKGPQQLAVVGVERLDKAAHAVLAAIGSDQHLAFDHGGRHRLRIALFRIGDLRLPQGLPRLRVERNELGVDRAHEQLAALDRHTAVVVAAAHRDDRTELVLVVPELLAGHRVDRIHVIERRGEEHHAVDDDRGRLHRFEHCRLEHVHRSQLPDIAGGDLAARVIARLLVAAVGMDPVLRVGAGGVEHRLRDGRRSLGHRSCGRCRRAGDFLGIRPTAPRESNDRHHRTACANVPKSHKSSRC